MRSNNQKGVFMKELKFNINKTLYYILIAIIILVMFTGVMVGNTHLDTFNLGILLHIILVTTLSVCLILYPTFETHYFRMLIMLIASAYFYGLFFLYPETWSTFVLICLIPAISILFFDPRLFYFSLFLNVMLTSATFAYIIFIDQGELYPHIKLDIVGNVINFAGIQAFLFLLFYISYFRIKQLKGYYEQVQQSERLKTTGQLAAAVAHEIRNPLTVVKGFLQLYKKEESFNEKVKRNFDLMIDELDAAEHVISHFLTIAKPDKEVKLGQIDVKDALQSVADLLNSYGLLNDNKIDLYVEDNCYIAINLIEFKQLTINLVKNAIEASSHGSAITVIGKKVKNSVEIRIVDGGLGMSESEIKDLGTPFYSLKTKGTGLGLMICFNIVEKYNGTIEFESVKGNGTTVIIRFPFVQIK
jgi:two-component system, sporulation sensor kinase B